MQGYTSLENARKSCGVLGSFEDLSISSSTSTWVIHHRRTLKSYGSYVRLIIALIVGVLEECQRRTA